MELTGDFVTSIAELGVKAHRAARTHTHTLDYEGKPQSYLFREHIDANGVILGEVVKPFRSPKLEVSTLTGFCEAIAAGVVGGLEDKIVHVEDHLTVSLKQRTSDKYGVRDTLLAAKHEPVNAFTFDKYYDDLQRFIIALQVGFLATDELLYLIRIASNLKAGNSVQTSDDGFSQTVTVRRGEVSAAEVKIQPRIKLIALRSFAEIEESNPVMSEFLLRFKQADQEQPAIGLFIVDNTRWKHDTMRSIRTYLAARLENVSILA